MNMFPALVFVIQIGQTLHSAWYLNKLYHINMLLAWSYRLTIVFCSFYMLEIVLRGTKIAIYYKHFMHWELRQLFGKYWEMWDCEQSIWLDDGFCCFLQSLKRESAPNKCFLWHCDWMIKLLFGFFLLVQYFNNCGQKSITNHVLYSRS